MRFPIHISMSVGVIVQILSFLGDTIYLTADFLVLTLKVFLLLLRWSLSLGCRACVVDVSIGVGQSTVNCSLCCYKETLFEWEMRATLICVNKDNFRCDRYRYIKCKQNESTAALAPQLPLPPLPFTGPWAISALFLELERFKKWEIQ